MNLQAKAVLTSVYADGNTNILTLTQEEPEPQAYAAVSDIVQITKAELAKNVLFVPQTTHHLRVEFEDGRDVFLSFNARVAIDRENGHEYIDCDLWGWHVDGLPVSEGDVDFLLPEGVTTLEEWLVRQSGPETDEVEPAAEELPPLSPPVDHCHVSTGPLWKRQAAVKGGAR